MHDTNVDLNVDVNAGVDLCNARVLHAAKDALKPRDNQMSFLACQSGPVKQPALRRSPNGAT